MKVAVNAETIGVRENATLADVLDQCGYGEARIAVAVNEEFVPRSAHGETTLQDGDRVDVVAPMQGG